VFAANSLQLDACGAQLKTHCLLRNLEFVSIDDLTSRVDQVEDINTAGVLREIECGLFLHIGLFKNLFTNEVEYLYGQPFPVLGYLKIDIAGRRVRVEPSYFGITGRTGLSL